jgi:aminopeptidase N
MIRRFNIVLFLGGVALSAFCDRALAQTAPGAGFDVTSYELALTPDIAQKTLAGREIISLRSTVDGLQRLSFSGNALIIERATLNGVDVPHYLRGNVLDFDLAKPLARGTIIKLELAYHGRPARGFVGTPKLLYTSYFACDWMICAQNAFGDKAAFSVDLQIPYGMDTLSVGQMISRRPGPSGSEIHRWKSPRPYSAYLFGFAIGKFASATEMVGAAKLTYLSDNADTAELKRRFATTRDAAAFFAMKSGVALPVARYSQLLVEGDEAQEAATYAVLGTEALPRYPRSPAEDWAIPHELAHQWWGNLATCATLKEFWLNEGVTTFMTAAWKEHRYGAAAYNDELNLARNRVAKARALDFDKPLAWDGSYPTLGTRRAIQYSKGALFMAHLRTTLGDAAFWSGLRRYTRTHAGGTVTSADLQRAMETSSRRDLRAVFAEWVFGDSSAEQLPKP